MTLKKLFATAASAALLTGAANAATIALGNADGAAAAAGDIESEVCVASETDITSNNTGTIEAIITTGGASEFTPGNGSHTFTVSLTGAAFTAAVVPATAIDEGTGAVVIANQTLASGGTAGSTSATITFDVTTANGAGDTLHVELPITVTQDSATISVSSGIGIGSGVTLLPTTSLDAVNFYDAYTAVVTSDAATEDSQINSSDLTDFVAQAGFTPADTATLVTLGQFTVTRNANITAANCGTTSIFESIATINTAAVTDASAALDVVLTPSVAQNATVTGIVGATGVAFGATAAEGFASGVAENIQVTTAGTATIAVSDVSAAATLDFTSTALVDEVLTAVALDDLNLSGDTEGPYQWVGDSSKTRNNVFRCTGDLANVSAVNSTMSNSSAGLTGATAALTAPGSTDVQYIVNGAALTTAHGSFGVADFSFEFVGASAIDCDRLMTSPADGIVTTYNGGN